MNNNNNYILKMNLYNPISLDPYKLISGKVLLPNLRLNLENKKIIFKPNFNQNFKYLKNEILYVAEFPFKSNFYYGDTKISYEVEDKEYQDGLVVSITYKDAPDIHKTDIQKFAYQVEKHIIGLIIDNIDIDNNEKYPFENYDNLKYNQDNETSENEFSEDEITEKETSENETSDINENNNGENDIYSDY